mmetsp:Transcript_19674/g.26610  ORF Transcript_19674/g.26610 Transcript_19674/m.26610 type:complete len:83 (+) Transcript_19674:111-359(+)
MASRQRGHMGIEKNVIYKIVILGDCSVGKTSIIQNFIRKTINHGYKPTIGADFNSKKLQMPLGDEMVTVTLQLWDTAGQERY